MSERRRRRVWLGLGANLGERAAQLARAVEALRESGVAVDCVSSLYDTAPWGDPPPGLDEPPRYRNAALSGETALAPDELLAAVKRIERAAGRALDAPRNSPRPLDIDLLLVEGEIVRTPALTVPHPRLQDRGFVLIPLAEIAAEAAHPLLARSIVELCDALPAAERAGVERVAGPGWERCV